MFGSESFAYLDFELEIEPGQGRSYGISVLRSPAGETRGTLRLPFDELRLENYLLALQNALLRSGGQRRKIFLPDEQAVQEFGTALFNALFDHEIRTCYDVSMREAARQGQGLRLKLRIQAPELASLPWEYLYDSRQARFICLSRTTPVVRYLELQQAVDPLTVRPPLRMLGMVASPDDLEPLDIANEKQRVERAIEQLRRRGIVELTWLDGQGWRDLQRAMRSGPWHIFHFIGHGGFDEPSGEGLIALSGDRGETYRLPAGSLAQLLADQAPLRLALLNSCDGARGSGRDIFSSTAATLVQRGIPSVLAMQFEITDQAAIEFSRSFYEGIADGLPVDAAVTEARKAISLAVANSMEWGTPVLYMRSPNGRIFDIVDRPVPSERAATSPEGQPAAASAAGHAAARGRDMPDHSDRERLLDDSYTRALSAYYTEQWEAAIALLTPIVQQHPGYRDAANKLRLATTQRELEQQWQAGAAAVERAAWSDAIAAYERVSAVDPGYQDVAARLAQARLRKSVAEMYEEARNLHGAGQWRAAINVLDKIKGLDGGFVDGDGLEAAARQQLAAAARRQELEKRYRSGLDYLEAGRPDLAEQVFGQLKQQQAPFGDLDLLLARAAKAAGAATAAPRTQPQQDATPPALAWLRTVALSQTSWLAVLLRWIVLSTVGLALITRAMAYVWGSFEDDRIEIPVGVLLLLACSFVLALLQWFALRPGSGLSEWWVAAVVVAWVAPYLLLFGIGTYIDDYDWPIAALLAGAALLSGVVPALPLWLVVRRQVYHSGWWLPVRGLGYALAASLALVAVLANNAEAKHWVMFAPYVAGVLAYHGYYWQAVGALAVAETLSGLALAVLYSSYRKPAASA